MRISIAFPIGARDQRYLPYSLGSVARAPVDEVVFLLDRCVSPVLARFARKPHPFRVKQIHKRVTTWNHPIAEAFEWAFWHCSGDILYTMAADMVSDPLIYGPHDFGRYDLLSFFYWQMSPGGLGLHEGYVNLLNRYLPFIYTCRFGKWSGHFGMRRRVWERLHYRDVASPDLDFFNRAYDAGFSHRYVSSCRNVHLRPGLTAAKQWGQGLQRAEAGVHPLKVVAHSVFEGKPRVLAAYLKAVLS